MTRGHAPAQITHGIHALLSQPWIYRFVQWLFHHSPTDRALKAWTGDCTGKTVLDVGCGPGEGIHQFSGARYIGFDLSPDYIAHAQTHHGRRGEFFCSSVDNLDVERLPVIDLVLMQGVLHHLSDRQIGDFFQRIAPRLSQGACVITIDPTYREGQSRLARWLVGQDRGKNVKTVDDYRAVSARYFAHVEAISITQCFPPYDRCLQRLQA